MRQLEGYTLLKWFLFGTYPLISFGQRVIEEEFLDRLTVPFHYVVSEFIEFLSQ